MSRGVEAVLQMDGIHLAYDNVTALSGVDFDLYPGEIHAVVGAHRAGKSTLVKILSGVLQKDAGRIVLKGRRVDRFTIRSAVHQGIGMIYQDSAVVPVLSTLENIHLGPAGMKWNGWINWRRKKEQIAALCEKYNMRISFRRSLSQNTLYEQHLVELLHVLVREPDILILDEISTRFNPQEMENIYSIIRHMKHTGRSVIYISHNMDEILRIADRVSILKDGHKLGTDSVRSLDKMRLLKLTYSSTLSRQELEAENLQLQYLKNYNEDILRNIPIGVVILTERNKVYLLNDTAQRILGLEQHEYSECPMEALLETKSFRGKEDLLQRLHERECFSLEQLEYEENRTLRVTAIPFRDEEESLLGTIVIIEDITKELNLMDYLLRVEKISSIAELAAGVAHEINNPLGIVQNYIDLLKEADLDPEPLTKISKIEREIRRIAGIVSGLLSFSKSGGLQFARLKIWSVIEEVVVLLEHRLKEKRVQMELRGSQLQLHCTGNENRLKQLFMNLIVNSLEAIPPGGRIRIELAEDQAKAAAVISVSDNGTGIPEEIRSQIFDPFFSTKSNKKNAGLGLSVCQHIVQLHRGTISCESKVGSHTCFRIELPLATQPVTALLAGCP